MVRPAERPYFLWDPDLAGFGLKVAPSGKRTFVVQYRMGGRGSPTKRWTIGKYGSPWTPEGARREARRILGLVANGEDPAGEKRAAREAPVDDDKLVEAVAHRWLDFKRRRGDRRITDLAAIFQANVFPVLGQRSIKSIRRADAHAIYDRLVARGVPTMGHRTVRTLSALMNYALQRDLIDANPLHKLELPETRTRDRILIKYHPERAPDPTELLAIWNAADELPDRLRVLVKLLILTGQRRIEVSGMKWDELDGGLWTIPADRHKSKRGHEVPLPEQALCLLDEMPRHHERVFAGIRAEYFTSFSVLKDAIDRVVQIEDWGWHDLRRTCASWIQLEFGLETMHSVLGHKLGNELAQIYARGVDWKRRSDALAAWANYVTGVSVDNVVGMTARR